MLNPGRRLTAKVNEATAPVLGTGEVIDAIGCCWATRQRIGVPLLFLARRQYLLALTNRRVLVIEGRGRAKGSLILGKRFETLGLVRVRARRVLFQVAVSGAGDVPLVFEFRPRFRAAGRALVRALEGSTGPANAPVPVAAAPAEPVPVATTEVPSSTEAFWNR